jgi:PAS domain S-box-containing protein
MPARIGVASTAEPFGSLFQQCLRAAGFDVLCLDTPAAARDLLGDGEIDLLVIDNSLASGSRGDWERVLRDAVRSSIPVLVAGPLEEREALLAEAAQWTGAIITYPMDPEAALQTVEAALADVPATEAAREVDGRPARTWPERIVSRVLRAQPGLGTIEASRAVLDQVSDAIFVFARTGEMVLINETACRMLGYERDEMLGRSAGILFPPIDQPAQVEGLDIRSAMSRFAVPPFDTTLRTASGHTIDVSFGTSFLRDEHGEVIGVLGIARDIGERRRLEDQLLRQNEILEEEVQARTSRIRASEARYRSLLEQIPFAVICADVDGRMASCNLAARRMFDWDDSVIGSALTDAWGCRCDKTSKACHTAAMAESVWAGECVMKRAGDANATMFHTRSPLRDDDGRVVGVVHALSDLSDPSAAHRELMRDAQGLVVCDSSGLQKIVTRSSKMQKVLDLIATCANTAATVLIEGESGTGKDLVARAFHLNSDRADGPYLVVNCATLDEHFLKSELFGHERGAFTGATARKQGLLEVADGGTLFIDEVGDMSPEVQAMLLRVLETGHFRRMGATSEEHVDVRIIGATNKDLEEEVDSGRFRQDLFYRLNVIRVLLPSLRDRPEDIRLLAEHFLFELGASQKAPSAATDAGGKGTRETKRLSADAMNLLAAYMWPGNVRELRNVIEQARILSKGRRIIGASHLPQRIARGVRTALRARKLYRSLAETEEAQVRKVLKAVGGNRTKAAKVLGISRTTLISKIRKYEL